MIPILNPLKQLARKLNHFKLQKPQVSKIYEVANVVRNIPLINNSQSSLDSVSLDQIKEFKGQRSEINKKEYYKMRLALDAASNPRYPIPTTTIYEPLPQSQSQIIKILTKFISKKLDSRQTLYLNQRIRSLINEQYINWDKLHLHEDAPYRRDLAQMPVLSKVAIQQEIRACSKKTIIKNVSEINQQFAKTKPVSAKKSTQQPQKIQPQQPQKGKKK